MWQLLTNISVCNFFIYQPYLGYDDVNTKLSQIRMRIPKGLVRQDYTCFAKMAVMFSNKVCPYTRQYFLLSVLVRGGRRQ